MKLRSYQPHLPLPLCADAVFQHGLAVCGHRNSELGRKGSRLGVLVGRIKHLPIAADRLVHLHGDGCVLVVAQRDFKFHLPDVARYALVVGLLVFGDHIKSVADMNVDVLILGGVVDAILAGKENAAFGVLLIDTDVTRRKRNSEAGLFFVFELVLTIPGTFHRSSWLLYLWLLEFFP